MSRFHCTSKLKRHKVSLSQVILLLAVIVSGVCTGQNAWSQGSAIFSGFWATARIGANGNFSLTMDQTIVSLDSTVQLWPWWEARREKLENLCYFWAYVHIVAHTFSWRERERGGRGCWPVIKCNASSSSSCTEQKKMKNSSLQYFFANVKRSNYWRGEDWCFPPKLVLCMWPNEINSSIPA